MCTENMVRMPKMSSSNCLLYIYMKKKEALNQRLFGILAQTIYLLATNTLR